MLSTKTFPRWFQCPVQCEDNCLSKEDLKHKCTRLTWKATAAHRSGSLKYKGVWVFEFLPDFPSDLDMTKVWEPMNLDTGNSWWVEPSTFWGRCPVSSGLAGVLPVQCLACSRCWVNNNYLIYLAQDAREEGCGHSRASGKAHMDYLYASGLVNYS